jgi:hypothetical protein
MRNFALLTLAAGAMALAVPSLSFADKDHDKTLKVGLWGDEFYSNDAAVKALQVEQTIHSMNEHKLDFTLFAGDTKNGSSECSDQAIGQDVIDIFDSLNAPTLYSLGDNEWTDCHRTNNAHVNADGSLTPYDPIERLSYLRTTFFSKNKMQGKHAFKVERQGDLGGAYSENSRFSKNNVQFVALHVVGSNNNLVVTDKQCFNKSKRTQADCDAATAEYQARNLKNVEWLRDSFAKAREDRNAGIAILIQADVYFPFELSDGGYTEFLAQLDPATNGYADFFKALIEETHNFDGQVLLIHGDSHYFKLDKAMFNDDGTLTSNFSRVEVFGSLENSWIEMTVDPSSKNVFTFAPVVLSH